MAEVSVRDLRNKGGQVLDRVAGGESVVITRNGQPVAELRQLARPPAVSASRLLERWRQVPAIDAALFRADLGDALDSRL
jgi:antitoxin (DNA-binding transcriptional repressor) of toxin-antitoxin stability system